MAKILVCNKNNKILENIKNLLDNNKIKFDLANSYEVMLDLAKKQTSKGQPYPVILTDLNLDKNDNDETVNNLLDNLTESTIIAMYSYSDYSTQWLNSEKRRNENILFLKKPFEDIELLQLIKNNINKKNSTLTIEQNGAVCDFTNPTKNLLSNISHEIRTPLASIVGITEVLQKTRLSDEQNRHVSSILKCSESLLNIISDMIDFENIQEQEITINSSDFNFTDLVEGCVTLVSRQAIEKDVDVNLSISENVPYFIHSDEPKLRKIIWNVVTNAVKYTNYGNVNVFCDYTTQKNNSTLTITVKDTGIGIDDESLKNLFTSFEDNSNPYRSGGSGIGLSMNKKLIDAFKGDIKVTSVVDKGSEFIITIPVENAYDKSLQLQFGKFTPLNIKKGIFVSNNKLTADAIIQQFAKQNCHLEFAENIRNARNIIQQSEDKLHWCVLDDSLVLKDNIPLLKNIILSCQQNNINLLLAAKSQSSINMMKSLGIQRVINKPCLEREVRQILAYHSDTAKDSSFAPSLIPMDNIRKSKVLKILVAEDNEINQIILSNMIKHNGHSIDIAKHGKIAVDKMQINKYDLVLMDLQMPILNGIEAAKKIRLNNKFTPIVAMTSNISSDLKQECELAGINEFLTKPINEQTLVKIIEKYSK
jgi:two-component system, sensor histidine kinase and response regulator